ncbi:MAG: hypothetical protein BRC40_11625, partial [Cyanobacteria bacterium QH_8_48_120]
MLCYHNLANFTINSVVAILCIAGIGALQFPRLEMQEIQPGKNEYLRQEENQATNLNSLKTLPSFGFDNLFADWLYLNFIQYFGNGEARSETGYSLSPEYFEAVVNHDPRFVQAYLALSPATTLYAGQPQKTVALIEEGLQSISPEISRKSPYLWMYKGSDEMLFLGDTEAAQHSYEMAAKWAETYD